jgi:hypothetical protein
LGFIPDAADGCLNDFTLASQKAEFLRLAEIQARNEYLAVPSSVKWSLWPAAAIREVVFTCLDTRMYEWTTVALQIICLIYAQ